jgi:hypothetical protein
MTKQKRAQVGGETGTNGEFYEGGKFLPSTSHPKRRGSAPKVARKQEIEPYTWVVAADPALRSLFAEISGIFGKYDHASKTFAFDCSDQTMAFYGFDEAACRDLIGRFNRGERWFTRPV